MTTPQGYTENMPKLQDIAREIAEEYYDANYPDIKGNDRVESIRWFTGRTGYVGIAQITQAVLNLKSESATKILPLLPWVIEVFQSPADLDDVIEAAINQPLAHETLKPFLEKILKEYSSEGTAHHFIGVARAITKSSNDEFKEMAMPHFPEALKRVSWSPWNFGNLSCRYLDMGGDVNDLKEGLNIILNSKEADAKDSFLPQSYEEKNR